MLLAGALGLLLMLAARTGDLPVRWSYIILDHAPMWGLGSIGLTALGLWVLWNQDHARTTWTPSVPGQRFRAIVVYSREECPLCDEAADLLARYQSWLPPPVVVDIDADPELRKQFGESVPVIECDGRIRFRGIVNELLLRRLIEGTPPLE